MIKKTHKIYKTKGWGGTEIASVEGVGD